MKISIDQYERLMRFLDLDMTAIEMKAFAEEMNNNPDLRQQFEFEESVRDGLEKLQANKIQSFVSPNEFTREELAQIRRETEQKTDTSEDKKNEVIPFHQNETAVNSPANTTGKKGKMSAFSFAWAIAATLLIAVFLVYLFNVRPSTNLPVAKNKDTNGVKKGNDNLVKIHEDSLIKTPLKKEINLASLFNNFYKKDTVPQQKPQLYASALEDYSDNDYSAIQKIDAYNLPEIRGPENDPLNNTKHVATIGHYYTGLSYIETGNLPKAIKDLRWVADSADDKSYAVKAQWYLALSYLKNGKADEAKRLLQRVAGNNLVTSYKAKAKELLGKIE